MSLWCVMTPPPSRSRPAPRRPAHLRRPQPGGRPGRLVPVSGLVVVLLAVATVALGYDVLDPTTAGVGQTGLADHWITSAPAAGAPTGAPSLLRGLDRPANSLPRDAVARASRPPSTSSAPSPPPAWSVVGLGDSVTAGTNCDCAPFVEQYAAITAQRLGRTVRSRNFGTPSLTSAGLLTQLDDGTDAATSVAGADIVMVTIGANDAAEAMSEWAAGSCGQACFDSDVATVQAQVTQVVDRILQLRQGRPTEVLVTTYWNVVQDGAVARQTFSPHYLQVSDALTREVNTALCSAAQTARDAGSQPGGGDSVICVDLYAPFKGTGDTDPTPLLAADGDHPDAAGHQLIATTLAGVGWAALEG
jgi:lysophospholipase L1-like esterase